jgi:hypothetical protein
MKLFIAQKLDICWTSLLEFFMDIKSSDIKKENNSKDQECKK